VVRVDVSPDDDEEVTTMLMRVDPFRELDRLTERLFEPGAWSRPSMPMDAHRTGDEFVVAFDLPGVAPDSIELDVDKNVLTVTAERGPAATGDQVETQISERPVGRFSRRLFLGDSLDTEHISAGYDAGVLTLRIPVLEQAKPRRIAIGQPGRKEINA
jgi:HSP20 family protein